jgi:hypothetical protein
MLACLNIISVNRHTFVKNAPFFKRAECLLSINQAAKTDTKMLKGEISVKFAASVDVGQVVALVLPDFLHRFVLCFNKNFQRVYVLLYVLQLRAFLQSPRLH